MRDGRPRLHDETQKSVLSRVSGYPDFRWPAHRRNDRNPSGDRGRRGVDRLGDGAILTAVGTSRPNSHPDHQCDRDRADGQRLALHTRPEQVLCLVPNGTADVCPAIAAWAVQAEHLAGLSRHTGWRARMSHRLCRADPNRHPDVQSGRHCHARNDAGGGGRGLRPRVQRRRARRTADRWRRRLRPDLGDRTAWLRPARIGSRRHGHTCGSGVRRSSQQQAQGSRSGAAIRTRHLQGRACQRTPAQSEQTTTTVW
ncbi:hypothetical protein EV192_1018 [Actinocrispum wychmicini]|uniref:Uncharacterized protein n=1 Tax=Actinocrispum wychmicini TaxID=1213861 RepID=A0A4R2JWP1_9PSEU|nr:hypothetical protein EV192_1018 [Actinocrispum wychmicini]